MGLAPDPDSEPMSGLADPWLCDRRENGEELHDVSAEEREAAISWMSTNVAIYVVSLPDDVAKWRKIAGRLHKLGIKAMRLFGVDLTKEGALAKAQADGIVPADWNYTVAWANMHKVLARSTQTAMISKLVEELGIGTVGCAAAHLFAMGLASNASRAHPKPLALIFEDDAHLEDDFVPKLRRLILGEAPCDWDAISLTSRCPYGTCVSKHLSRVQPDGNEPSERCHNGVNWGFYGMLYKAASLDSIRTKLRRVMFNDSQPACLPVDVAMASISDQVSYYAVPGLQQPGLMREAPHGSHRRQINHDFVPSTTDAKLDKTLAGKR